MKRRLLQNLIEAVWGGDSPFLLGWSKSQWNKFGVTALAVFFVGPMAAYLIGFDPTNAILWFTGIVILAYAIETQELRLQVMVQTQISQQSLIEVIKSNILTQQTFDDEFKKVKGRAYWALYRAHNMLDRRNAFNPDLVDLAAVQDLLSIYGSRLTEEAREHIRVALNGVDLIVTFPGAKNPVDGSSYLALFEKVRPHLRDAAMAVREEWMTEWGESNPRGVFDL